MGLEGHSVSSWTITPVVLALGQAVNSTVRIKIGMSTSTLTNTQSVTPTTIIHSSFLPDDVCFFHPLSSASHFRPLKNFQSCVLD